MRRQAGVTLIGFVIILMIAAFFVYTGMKLVPAYYDFFNVSKALTSVSTESESGAGVEDVRRQLETQQLSQYFDDSDIDAKNISVINNANGGAQLRLRYDKKIPWVYNISFLVHFEKSVPIKLQQQE
jgi:hypothetical protein